MLGENFCTENLVAVYCRCFRIHVLMRVVFTLCVSILTQTAMTAVSPMSGALTFDTGKLRRALRAGRVMMIMVMTMLNSGNSDDERC